MHFIVANLIEGNFKKMFFKYIQGRDQGKQ